MTLTELHATVLSQALEAVLGKPEPGTMAYIRCLSPEVVEALARDSRFALPGWDVFRVADREDKTARTITADQAVERREAKGPPTLLLVDTDCAGAGMDGIYSAAREVDELSLFNEVRRRMVSELTRRFNATVRDYAEQAIKKAKGFGQRFSISPWAEFDFLARCAATGEHPGHLLYLLGLWPVEPQEESDAKGELDISRLFVERLLGNTVAGQPPAQRIAGLRLLDPTEKQRVDLEHFLRAAGTKSLLSGLEDLADKPHLWVGALKLEAAAQQIERIELVPWRTSTGKLAKWSGLIDAPDPDDPPQLIIEPDEEQRGAYSKLEVRWKVVPSHLQKGAAEYHVGIVTDMDEELVSQDVTHSGKKEEKCRFTKEDFATLPEDALVNAKIRVSVLGNDEIEAQESEEFVIRFGTPPEGLQAGIGKKVRTFSEGVIELHDEDAVTELASSDKPFPVDKKFYVLLRTGQHGKSFRVYRPPLIADVEKQWTARGGEIGRWRVRVRISGTRVGEPEFVPLEPVEFEGGEAASAWDRALNASRRMAERIASCGGGVGQVYDQRSRSFENVVKEYLLAWSALLSQADPQLALVHTVEVQSFSGRTLGLIVLPTHPLRVAWHVAYDNLVLFSRFKEGAAVSDIRRELALLDGAMFPPFLPGLENGQTFVFADTLGFHAVAMVPAEDKEPKAALAIMARALGESEANDTAPTVGQQSAEVLGKEILKYLQCHQIPRVLQVHALRPGDGLTVARSLGHVYRHYGATLADEEAEDEQEAGEETTAPPFALDLYPSKEQRGIAGRFISEVLERRRRGAGAIAEQDRWMLESLSLPGGINLPRLRWARREKPKPESAAHLAVAFDTFESQVVVDNENTQAKSRPLFAFGLLSFYERQYTSRPAPRWRSLPLVSTEGEKHPSERFHTERLIRLQTAVQQCVARNLAANSALPILSTEISLEKADDLREIHRLCDWVITLDRNAGIEYFDSPRYDKEIYDAYVIDCVPEREDLGCLQLITSTANLEEVRNLLDRALEQLGLSRSRRNAEFLMEHLKALSGRLAIRLTGQKPATSELIALALSHAHCRVAQEADDCWTPLKNGFLIPVDDICDLLPPLSPSSVAQPVREEEQEPVERQGTRPDLIYVSVVPRRGLQFRFIEVKYRRHLRAARSADLLEDLRRQVESLRKRWDEWYAVEELPATFRAVRRAKLARVLRFYADKAHRHSLPDEVYDTIVAEIDRMIEKGKDYSFANSDGADRGWIFCPEYAGVQPMEIAPDDRSVRVFLFGPAMLPDSSFRRDSLAPPSTAVDQPQQAVVEPLFTQDQPSVAVASIDSRITASHSDNQPATPTAVTELFGNSREQATGEESQETPPAICLGTDLVTGAEVSWTLTIRGNPHLLIAGLPGMGKTSCLLNICRQMLESGIRPIVFSYHQDIDQKLAKMVESMRFIDFHGLGFNPLHVLDRQSRQAYLDVAGALRDIFLAIFPELGDIQAERIRRAIKDSFRERGWGDPNADRANLAEPPFARFLEILRADPKPDRGLKTLLARLEELEDYGFFQPGESHESLWESTQPIIIRIHTTQNDNLQKAFASLVFYGLYKDMFRRGLQTRITHAVLFDEAHRAARLSLIPTMAKECRKYGISLILASQEARDFHVSVFSAIANYLVLRLNDIDAKALVRNVASSDQERALIDKIKQMEHYKAFYFCEGKKRPSLVALRAPKESNI